MNIIWMKTIELSKNSNTKCVNNEVNYDTTLCGCAQEYTRYFFYINNWIKFSICFAIQKFKSQMSDIIIHQLIIRFLWPIHATISVCIIFLFSFHFWRWLFQILRLFRWTFANNSDNAMNGWMKKKVCTLINNNPCTLCPQGNISRHLILQVNTTTKAVLPIPISYEL